MRCFEWAAPMAALVVLAGCATLSARVGMTTILGGYKLMGAAMSDVPIGAAWRQGYGPVGPGTTPDNIVVRRSFSSLTLSRAAQAGLEVKLAEMLDLHPGVTAKLSVTVSEMSISSVADVAKLGLSPGDMFLSDAIKASKVTITTESNVATDLVAGLTARGLPVATQANADGEQTLSVEGVDLFFAYRVARIERTKAGQLTSRVVPTPSASGW